jgi:Dolichyl-phosphate-mannose-protein mannosyltransferase
MNTSAAAVMEAPAGELMAEGEPTETRSRSWASVVAVASLAAGLVLRFAAFLQPLNQPVWRQGDLYAIARSFQREGFNPLLPKVAWRGSTSGAVEGEFPLISWTTGMAWRLFGEHGWMLKVLPFLAGLLSLVVFVALVRRRLAQPAAAWAIALFSLSPLAVFVTGAVQSDSLMLLGSLVAVWASWHWADAITTAQESVPLGSMPSPVPGVPTRWPILVVAGLSLAGLSKITAVHIGFAVAAVLLIAGPSARIVLRRKDVWVAAVFGLAIPALWSTYAHTIYKRTGLSLGVSNERHWAGSELLRDSSLIKGIVGHELRFVWFRVGIAIAGLGVLLQLRRERKRKGFLPRATQVVLVWLIAAGLMLLVAGRTTGDEWAFYYHLVAVAPAAMLIGIGLHELENVLNRIVHRNTKRESSTSLHRSGFGARVATTVLGVLLCLLGARSAGAFARPAPASGLYRCAQMFRPLIKSDRILTSGGTRFDSGGHGVAYDASYMFQWLDVFGSTISIEDQSVAAIARQSAKGTKWFIAEREATAQKVGFDKQLRKAYPVAAECSDAVLYEVGK